jgi:DNA-binding MarR family transcriptional regulator
MPKSPVISAIHDPISAILGTRGKVAVMRVLASAGNPLQQREVARRTGMALRTVELAIDDLIASGIVERMPGGRERLVQIRSGHRLTPAILAVLRAGADHWPALRGELRAAAASSQDPALLAVAVVGRAATRDERLGDPVDLLIITTDNPSAKRWVDRYTALGDGIASRFGATLRPIGYDLAEAKQVWAVRTSAAERAVLQAELIHGTEVRSLLDPSDR